MFESPLPSVFARRSEESVTESPSLFHMLSWTNLTPSVAEPEVDFYYVSSVSIKVEGDKKSKGPKKLLKNLKKARIPKAH
mmetsp:Transcript_40548/g.160856  ORF Transcript_40548/g.160856 Transcript_40548/m.160856 type:complete len:80 (+) Transcript_40548:382-621(+)